MTEQGGRAVAWGYDNVYHLTSEAVTGGAVAGTSGYTYDVAGNRLSRTSTLGSISPQTYTPNNADELSAETYDGNGNVTGSSGNTYTYNSLGRLTSATVNGVTTTYVYDPDGILVSKTTNGVTTKFLTDGGVLNGYPQVLAEIQGGNVVRSYVYGLGRVSMTDPVANKTYYFGADAQGSTRALMNESGAVTDTFDWAADGILLSRTGTTVCPFGFQGEYADADTGLVYMRARWMNPQTGRFMGMDGFEGENESPSTLQKYSFTAGDGGVNRIDPSGNDSLAEEGTAAAGEGILGGGFGISQIQTQLLRAFAGAATGAVIGGVDSKLGGGTFFDGVKSGAIQGAILGPLLYWSRIAPALRVTGALLAGYGVGSSLEEGNDSQAVFRAFLGFFAVAKELPKLPSMNLGGTLSVDIGSLVPNPDDDYFKVGPSETALQKYAAEIRSTGNISEPLEVQDLGGGKYGILNGHHRWAVAQRFGLTSMTVHIEK